MAGEGGIDRIVQDAFFKDKRDGVFVDVGAADPEYLSISHRFRLAGWKIIAIEPNPEFCKRYIERGYHVFECACGDRDEDSVWFCVVDSHGQPYEGGQVSFESYSALDPRYGVPPGATMKKIKVNLRRLDTILESRYPSIETIDILSVDVEGYELDVLRGFSIEKYKPKVVILENLADADEYRSVMAYRGYALWRKIAPNEVYIPV